MKKKSLLLFLLGCAAACNSVDTLDPPQISIDLSPVWVGVRSIAEEAPEKSFNLQIRNIGEETLKIDKVTVKGDQHCAFRWEGPDVTSLGADGSAFIRMWYKPTERGDDSIALRITSNSEKYNPFVVPICGRGALQEEIDQMAEVDGGTADEEAPTCSAPLADQPDCSETKDTDTDA